MEIESMKSGAAASYQGSAAASTKTLDTAVQPEASTQAGLSQTADKKPTVQNFFTEQDQEDKDLSEEKDAKQGTQLKKAVNDLNKQMKNSEAIFGIHDKTNRVTIKIIDKTTKEVIKEYPPEETLDMIAKVWEIAGILVDEKL
ncbi:flagellar protein FlaG [Roseburia hominis]|uniref:flagellar protein FlaG n=1 Tax=Roseburia hominis TaxID=301301 RepID=UPI0026DCB117|nr:flagellar protein FlaG [Roseburia hominis]